MPWAALKRSVPILPMGAQRRLSNHGLSTKYRYIGAAFVPSCLLRGDYYTSRRTSHLDKFHDRAMGKARMQKRCIANNKPQASVGEQVVRRPCRLLVKVAS